ncbi:MAG: helix-turn-helix domain-containing protein [Pelolinea sp.]|nr:helix-turn-helix domain-containing protein [Pelolinea sp.]
MDPETGKPPNKYTIAMGELIRQAREEVGLSQEELAKKIFRKRLSVSEMEKGKVEFSAWVLPYLSAALNKPIVYFFPKGIVENIREDSLSSLEQELLSNFRRIWDERIQRVAINQIKSIADLDVKALIIDSIDIVENQKQMENDTIEYLKKHNK